MALVSIGLFDPAKKAATVPANVSEDKELYLVFDNLTVAEHYGIDVPPQHVRVVIKNNNGSVASDEEYSVGATKAGGKIVTSGIPMKKGTMAATLLPGKNGPCDYLIGIYIG